MKLPDSRNMRLHERIYTGDIDKHGYEWEIVRVPNGYIYTTANIKNVDTVAVFVPLGIEHLKIDIDNT